MPWLLSPTTTNLAATIQRPVQSISGLSGILALPLLVVAFSNEIVVYHVVVGKTPQQQQRAAATTPVTIPTLAMLKFMTTNEVSEMSTRSTLVEVGMKAANSICDAIMTLMVPLERCLSRQSTQLSEMANYTTWRCQLGG